jgi:hypothetical protein
MHQGNEQQRAPSMSLQHVAEADTRPQSGQDGRASDGGDSQMDPYDASGGGFAAIRPSSETRKGLQSVGPASAEDSLRPCTSRLSSASDKSLPRLPPALDYPSAPSTHFTAPGQLSTMPLTGDGRPWSQPDNSLNSPEIVRREGRTPTRPRTTQPPSNAGLAPRPTIPPTTSRFSVLTANTVSAISRLTAPPAGSFVAQDELLTISVESALFPAGLPSGGDAFSPSAYKNLQITAVGLARRLQTAYQQSAQALRDSQAEREAECEELDEANTRAQHLKQQLEDMARKAEEHEAAMQELMVQLVAERKARADDLERSARRNGLSPLVASEGSTVSEDLGVDDDERTRKSRDWRRSGETSKSEASFDTDEETLENESVFSRSRSPTLALMQSGAGMDGKASEARILQPRTAGINAQVKAKPAAQMSRFQKMFRGVAGESTKREEENRGATCPNCLGQDAGTAWNTVGLLRDENRGLKDRIGELEHAVEGALDVVKGIGV